MATVVMDMSGYGVEHETPTPENYSEEVMYAEWNPQLGLMEAQTAATGDKRAVLDHGLAAVDIDTFLKKMYCNQR
ncbi:MAG: hypothetical protein Q8L69_07800 [Gallionellaceae bacterium]|nr:hypothetical protein [Gallionellaceae bacterium]